MTTKDVYSLPRVEDILDTLGKAKYFSTSDLSSGYWQVPLDDDARTKTAFTTHQGLFEFVRMPFGLCNVPATFQRVMQSVLAGLVWRSCFVYIDDIFIASPTFKQHLQHVEEMFDRLRKANLRLKPKKCCFLRDEVTYLGHVLSAKGVQPDSEKTEKVRSFPIPTDVTQVRQFLGLAFILQVVCAKFHKDSSPFARLAEQRGCILLDRRVYQGFQPAYGSSYLLTSSCLSSVWTRA